MVNVRDFTQDMVNVLVREQLLVHTSPPRQLLCSPLFLQSQFLPSDGLGLVVEGHAACIGVGLCAGAAGPRIKEIEVESVRVSSSMSTAHTVENGGGLWVPSSEGGRGRGRDVRGKVYTSSSVYPPA